MEVEFVTLIVIGMPGADFSVQPRDHSDPPPPAIVDAAVGTKGRASVLLPRGYYVVHGGGKTQPADFTVPSKPKKLTVTL